MTAVMPGQSIETDAAWLVCEREAVAAVGAINLATASLVDTIGVLLDTNGGMGHGIQSPEHWVMWKTDVSRRRAEGLVKIARRRDDLPVCWGLFRQGRLTEDAMVRIARRVPASRDAEVAGIAPGLLISQLTRVLAALPELPDPNPQPKPERERYLHLGVDRDGWGQGRWSLPPDEHALLVAALTAGRDAEFRDRNDRAPDAEVTDTEGRSVSWADGLVRMASEAADALDATLQRTGYRGERHQIVLHHHVQADGTAGPGRLHLGPFLQRSLAQYLACDAKVIVLAWQDGKLLGINPAERTPNRRLRRALEHRDGGCAHPLCVQKRWLHAHHIRHWEDGGLTIAANLVMLCPTHHRALHMGDFTITGNPDDGTLAFLDRHGQRIEPPPLGADPLPPPPPDQLHYHPPYGERLSARDFSWN